MADGSGSGDGGYPVCRGSAADGWLVAVHIAFDNAALALNRFRGQRRPVSISGPNNALRLG